MSQDTWNIIPKCSGKLKLILKADVKKNGVKRYTLFIPVAVRKKSEYFENWKLMYCNLLEKGRLLMIQFVPKDSLIEDSHKIYHGQLNIRRDVFNIDPDYKGKFEVKYKLDNGNIIIDRQNLTI